MEVIGDMKTKKVLWISRHEPLQVQKEELARRLGDFELIIHKEPIATAEKAVELAKSVKADYIVPVLPMTFTMHLVAAAKRENFVVLRAEMETIHNCKQTPCPEFIEETDTIMISKDLTTLDMIRRHFRFREFVILKDIKIITEPF